MPEDTIEVIHSEEEVTTPTETPNVEPEPTQEPVQPTPNELFELPDGRKVDAMTLSKEWKENFYPEYTRKSQALAEKEIKNKPETPDNPYADPEYVPQSYEELLQIAEQRALAAFEAKQSETIKAQQELESEISNQLNEVKTLDPNLNENALFLHATKYGFRDLKLAHQNMKDMSEIVKNVQKTTADNIAKRNDPVSVVPGATGIKPDPSNFSTARDYLRSINK